MTDNIMTMIEELRKSGCMKTWSFAEKQQNI
jgi:hypothetical protein